MKRLKFSYYASNYLDCFDVLIWSSFTDQFLAMLECSMFFLGPFFF